LLYQRLRWTIGCRDLLSLPALAERCSLVSALVAKNILYAEDDPNDMVLVQVAFQDRRDVDLHFVRDGVEAVNYLAGRELFADRRIHPLPDLVMLDIKMPRLSGFDVLAWLRQQPHVSAIPVVVVSSSEQQSDVNRAYQLGANAYVVKPSGFRRLQSVLLQTVDFFLVHALQPLNPAPPPSSPHLRQ
jgi:CheY-like chemotaxis protein